MAEWSKAPALGAGPKGRGFEPHCCQFLHSAKLPYFPLMMVIEKLNWACGVVVSRLLCMQKASGSNPDESTFVVRRAFRAHRRELRQASLIDLQAGPVV